MNRYLAEMSDILIEEGGYLDKFIGDAIMGVFGAPEVLPNHALSACRTALRSQRRLAEISPGIESEYGVRLSARIGINTGEVVVGNFGSERKRNYSVVGDTANFASRLEAANKEFGSEILIGPETAEMVKGELLTRPVARLRVPGKSQPQETFELLGEAGDGGGEWDEFLQAYLAGYESFFRRDFPAAEQNFRIACAVKPADKVAAFYLQQAAKWVLSAPPPDWEGIYVINSK
jgi:adenylate cyclase